MTDTLLNIDCRTALKQLQDESIDCIVSDVPYRIVSGGCSADTYKDKNGHSQPSGLLNRQRVETRVGGG